MPGPVRLGASLFASGREPSFTTFDAPGAVGSFALSIKPYLDASLVLHGFLRAADGTFAAFGGQPLRGGQNTYRVPYAPWVRERQEQMEADVR